MNDRDKDIIIISALGLSENNPKTKAFMVNLEQKGASEIWKNFIRFSSSDDYVLGIRRFLQMLNNPNNSEQTQKISISEFQKWIDFTNGEGVNAGYLEAKLILKFVERKNSLSARQDSAAFIKRFAKFLRNYAVEPQIRELLETWASEYPNILAVRFLGGEKEVRQKNFLENWQYEALINFWWDMYQFNPLDPLLLRNAAMIALGLGAAARRREILSLQVQDVDLTNWIVTLLSGKGGKTRQVAILIQHESIQLWHTYINTLGRNYLFPSFWRPRHSKNVDKNNVRVTDAKYKFIGDKLPKMEMKVLSRNLKEDKPANNWSYDYAVIDACSALIDLGIFDEDRRIRTHDMRRTGASTIAYREFDYDELELREHLGHDRFETTERYIKAASIHERLAKRDKILAERRVTTERLASKSRKK